MSLKAFNNSWITLRKKPGNSNLKNAIRYWCIELKLDDSDIISVERNIHEWIQNAKIINFAMAFARQFELLVLRKFFWSNLGGLKSDEFKQYIEEKREVIERQNNVETILLLSFVLVGVGFLLHSLNKNAQQEEKRSDSGSSNRYPVTSLNQKDILILVVNADREDFINSLEEQNRITEADWEELYNATQFLWMGTESEFSNSDISNYFSQSNTENFDPSEYDVRFIRIDLSKPEPGFQPDVLQIDRRDAFQSLPETSREISISPRLFSEAYSGKGFYNR